MVKFLVNFNFLTGFYLNIFKLVIYLIYYPIYGIYIILVYIKNFLNYILQKNKFLNTFYNTTKTFIFNFILYFTKILPWWFFNIFVKTFIINTSIQLSNILKEYFIYVKIVNILKNILFFLCVFLKKIKKFIFGIITHLYLFVKKNKETIKKIFYLLLNIVLLTFSIFIIFYLNLFVLLHNFFFDGLFDVAKIWISSDIYNYIFIIIALLNVDNLILYIYIVFIKVGFWNVVLNLKSAENLYSSYWVSYYWFMHFRVYKSTDSNFSFTNLIFNKIMESGVTLNDFVIWFCSFFNPNIPFFFYFGLLFFLSVVFSWFFLSYLGLNGLFILNLTTIFFFWVSLITYIDSIFVQQKSFIINIGSWVFLNLNIKVDYYFLIDTISFSFILLTTSIALFVFIYAFSYFRYEPLVDRFLLFILSFVISMIFLVSSGNTIMLFLGWELIGFTSFCLINFWTTKTATLKSAFKAFTFNKISDFFLFLFIVFSFSIYYTFDILQLNKNVSTFNQYVIYFFNNQINSIEIIALLLLGAAFIKSAQFGGHAWLPDSMEAPVPASALIHSATLVSAGVYLILRFNPIFDLTEFVKLIIPVVGSITAAYGGVCAISQSDIKKTLAYSTISHCGFLMVLCSTEMNEFTILYLYVHGFFKAGVFMCVGNVLRISRGYQDTRRMGGLLKYLPFDYFCITIGLLNLAGIPFTFGFVIKHLLLISLNDNLYLYYFVLFNSFIGAFAGLFYSYKIINYTFCDFKKGDIVLYNNLNKNNYNSKIYTNSSLASTISILCLFLSAYIIIAYMFNCFLVGNYQFSDYLNTTLLSSYFVIDYTFGGFLLNFSYINIVAIIVINYLFLSTFRKINLYQNKLKLFIFIFIFYIFIFIFYNIL